MAAITIKGFRGTVPRTSGRLLTPNFASEATNIKITSGRIDPLRGLALSHTSLAAAIRTIWRYRFTQADRSTVDNWFTFPGDADVVASLIANDADGRVFWTSDDHEPRMSTYEVAINGGGPYPDAWYALGLPLPPAAPVLTADVSSGTVTAAVANTPSANKVQVTFNTVEGLAVGDSVTFASVGGMTSLNTTLVVESITGLNVVFPLVTSQVYTSGGTWSRAGITVDRSYAFTFVTALGEESGPSPATTLRSGLVNGAWELTGIQTAPPNSGTITAVANNTPSPGYVTATFDTAFGLAAFDTLTMASIGGMTDLNGAHRISSVEGDDVVFQLETAQTYTSGGTWVRDAPINTTGMVKRIYRTDGTAAQFFFLAEIPAATTTYSDTTIVLTGDPIQTADHLPPPKNATSMITLPNGCTVLLAGNEVCFSVPYQPHSYPVSNRYSFVGRGVAIFPAGNSVIVLTDKYPVLLTGSDPESMSPSIMETYAPCVSKRGAVDVGGGCIYPSHDGLWLATAGRVENLTKRLYREDEWRTNSPATFDAAYHDGQYYAVHTPVGAERARMMVADIPELDSVVFVDETADFLYRNDYDGELYILKDQKVYRWDARDDARYPSEWRSSEIQLDKPRNFSVAQVHARFGDIVEPDTTLDDANAAIFASGPDAVGGYFGSEPFGVLPVGGTHLWLLDLLSFRRVQFTIYDGDTPIFSREVSNSKPFKLPAGLKQEILRIGIGASVGVYSVTVAESTAELARASQ
ncbi:hypothetical protein F3K02_08960 [Hydrogenophaga sp. D2P1]|uniref:Ubiquitin-activating enzyme E1 FCCH domain-containing protein n=1 Tax=Hydrogenophaga aromaticivorans TaxID=2610898 RepID=A0A7Y8KWE0_9BURK|nr:hypothetical protein [Hydrogenophaga aromaticivorans]NWF45375.1 hypothetical protein [Hydrogenophaga aromaticivorans]